MAVRGSNYVFYSTLRRIIS